MKKILTISLIFSLIVITSFIKNSTKKIDEELFSLKENILNLNLELDNVKLEFDYLSSSEKLLSYQNLYFENKLTLKNINEIDQGVNEGRYHDFRNNEELTPRQKIGHSMREVRAKLTELSKLIDMNVRLKNELGVNSDQYWKNTHKALNKISERLVKLANKVGQLK